MFQTYNVNTPALDGYIYNTDQVEEEDTAVQGVAASDEKQYKSCDVDCEGKWEDNGQCEDYWKKQKYTITQEKRNAGKSCPHKKGDVKTLRPGIHTCKAVHNKRCNWGTVFGCGSYHHWTTYTPNGL